MQLEKVLTSVNNIDNILIEVPTKIDPYEKQASHSKRGLYTRTIPLFFKVWQKLQ
jgi:hypothetical protein